MAPITTAQEYQAVREAIQKLSTLDGSGNRQDSVSVSVEGMSVTYNASQLTSLQDREKELAKRLTQRNIRKRTISTFSDRNHRDYNS